MELRTLMDLWIQSAHQADRVEFQKLKTRLWKYHKTITRNSDPGLKSQEDNYSFYDQGVYQKE